MDQLEQLTAALRRDCPAVELREWEPMARHTTFRIGGPVRLMALPKTAEEAEQVLRLAAEREIQPFFLGNGSNLLVADEGYHGFALKLAGELDRIHMREGRLSAGGAVLLSRLAGVALSRGLSGLEFAHGIPGSLGGAVTMNAGAYGGEMVQVVASVTCLSRRGEVETVPAERCAFSYRHSAFSDGGRLILKVEFCLRPGDPEEIRAKMEDYAQRRREKQPLEYPSAGSMFKRPKGHYAAALIEQCGLKGLTVGGAQVSEKHAGFVINRGGATCGDVLSLVEQVRERVLAQTGVELEMEVRVLR